MPAVLALPAFWGAVAAGAATTGAIVGAKIQSGAVKRGAELQDKANTKALAFKRQQAEADYRSAETTRRANYDQWASRERRLGSVGELLGYRPRQVPAYVPEPDPNLNPSTAAHPRAPGAPVTSYTPTTGFSRGVPTSGRPGGPVNGDYQGWFNSLVAGKPWNQQTLLDLEPTLKQQGITLTPPNAVGDRTKIQLPTGEWVRVGFGEGRPVWVSQGAPGAPAARGSVGSYLRAPQAYAPIQMTPGLLPPTASRRGSVGSYLR